MSYHRDNRPGGNSGKKYARRGAEPTMHKAVCNECNKECEVPFKPIGGKPVFCRNCFKRKEDSSPRESGSRDFGRTTMHQAICSECDRECEVPFKPVGNKPIFCKHCFGAPRKITGDVTNEQFEVLNSKLDKILDLLNS